MVHVQIYFSRTRVGPEVWIYTAASWHEQSNACSPPRPFRTWVRKVQHPSVCRNNLVTINGAVLWVRLKTLRPESQKVWHNTDPSLLKGSAPKLGSKCCSLSPAMVMSPYEWKIPKWDVKQYIKKNHDNQLNHSLPNNRVLTKLKCYSSQVDS
jgi:hypothetical protein